MVYRKEAKRKTIILRIFTNDNQRRDQEGFLEAWQCLEALIQDGLITMEKVVESARKNPVPLAIIFTLKEDLKLELGLDLLEFDGELTEKQYNQLIEFTHQNIGRHPFRKDYWIGIVDE